MQCRTQKIRIVRKVVRSIEDKSLQEICNLLMKGYSLQDVRSRLAIPPAPFGMLMFEIKRLLLNAGLEVGIA